jgi:hypothetical protein
LSVAALQAAQTNLRKTLGPRGEIMPLTGKLVVVSPDQEWLVREILNSSQLPYTSDNTSNEVRKGLDYKVWTYLTDSNAWFLRSQLAPMDKQGKPTGPGATTVFVWRIQPEFDRDTVYDSGDRRYKGRMRLGTGRLDWRGWYGSSGVN